MSTFVWYRIVVRLFGLWLVAFGLPALLSALLWFVTLWQSAEPNWFQSVLVLLGPLVQLGVGLYLLFGSGRLVRRSVLDALTLCPRCGYDNRGISARQCPECGTVVVWEEEAKA